MFVSVTDASGAIATEVPGASLRAWQRRALTRYLATKPRDFLAVATPGAGKTTFALRVAAELLADRGCQVRVTTPGMIVGQDLGITLDMEMFLVRAHARGIRLETDEVVLAGAAVSDGLELQMLRHTTGVTSPLRVDWVVCATHPAPEDELWRELRDVPFEVHRVGDCVAPRRAHAAVVEGHRVGVAL